MIFRVSTGKARTAADADSYAKFLDMSVFPELLQISGHCGGYLLRRTIGGGEEMVIVTMWDSLDAIRAFAGEDVESAVFEPEFAITKLCWIVARFERKLVSWDGGGRRSSER